MDDDIRDWRERETRALLRRPERPPDGRMTWPERVAFAALTLLACLAGYFTFLIGAGVL